MIDILMVSTLLSVYLTALALRYFGSNSARIFVNTYLIRRWKFMAYLFFFFGFALMYIMRNSDMCMGLIIIGGLIIAIYMMAIDHFIERDMEATKNVVDITKIT